MFFDTVLYKTTLIANIIVVQNTDWIVIEILKTHLKKKNSVSELNDDFHLIFFLSQPLFIKVCCNY